ncbi:CinA family protein [Gordonia liuliyuniae]|uniref:CinA family protein n=1 Tax=Gordonia liuliyuniae TaxID=2911517 RepID=A0ABS9IQI4_9ACTN|nr:CinA family protein [Gordonia liuliyuniae]MCF8587818.1 CinA family protein [Gordonia liuliyuniae]
MATSPTSDNAAADNAARAEQVGELAHRAGRTVATAESLTGGQIACTLGAAPDSSEWYRGSIVAYASTVKHQLLRVPDVPVVSEISARTMAVTTAELLGADLVVAVTGAAGPGAQEGREPGTVWFGIVDGDDISTEYREFDGSAVDVVSQTVTEALDLFAAALGGPS